MSEFQKCYQKDLQNEIESELKVQTFQQEKLYESISKKLICEILNLPERISTQYLLQRVQHLQNLQQKNKTEKINQNRYLSLRSQILKLKEILSETLTKNIRNEFQMIIEKQKYRKSMRQELEKQYQDKKQNKEFQRIIESISPSKQNLQRQEITLQKTTKQKGFLLFRAENYNDVRAKVLSNYQTDQQNQTQISREIARKMLQKWSSLTFNEQKKYSQ